MKKRQCPYCHGSGTDPRMAPADLVALIKSAGISQRELARRMEVSASYVNDMKHGRRAIGPDIAKRIRRALGQ